MSDEQDPPSEGNVVPFRRKSGSESGANSSRRKRRQTPVWSGGPTSLKPGYNVTCRVTKAEAGGYAVIELSEGLPGYLPTSVSFRIGEQLLLNFVCIDKNRMLLSRLAHSVPEDLD